MHATLTWLCGFDSDGRRAGVARVHPREGDPAYVWACPIADDGSGGLEFHGAVDMDGKDTPDQKARRYRLRSALHTAALDCGFDRVLWYRLKGQEMVSRVFDLHGRDGPVSTDGRYAFSWANGLLTIGQQHVRMRGIRADLFHALHAQINKTVTAAALADAVYGVGDAPDDAERAIRAHVKALRDTLSRTRLVVETIGGQGYRLRVRRS